MNNYSSFIKAIHIFGQFHHPMDALRTHFSAELFLVHQSDNPKKLVKAWHTIPEEKYDFSIQNSSFPFQSSADYHHLDGFKDG